MKNKNYEIYLDLAIDIIPLLWMTITFSFRPMQPLYLILRSISSIFDKHLDRGVPDRQGAQRKLGSLFF